MGFLFFVCVSVFLLLANQKKKEKKWMRERERGRETVEMGKKIEKKKNKKNNGRFGGTNCVPVLPSRRTASNGPVRPQIASIELGFKGASKVPAFLVLNLAAGVRSSRVTIVCRWSCSRIGGAMYVIHADDALDSLIADVQSRGVFCFSFCFVFLQLVVSSLIWNFNLSAHPFEESLAISVHVFTLFT